MSARATMAAALLTLAATQAGAAPRLFEATVAPDTVTVGDKVRFTLRVERDAGGDVVYPNVEEAAAPFELLDVVDLPVEERGETALQGRVYVLAAYETGALGIPQLEVGIVDAEGETSYVFTDSLPVAVKTVLPEINEGDRPEPRPIKEPIELPRRIWPYVLVAIATAAVGIYLLRRWWRRRAEGRPEPEPEEPAVPRRAAHLVALERLRALREDDPIGRGRLDIFYPRVTEILRRYVGDRYGVDAIDMTTSEIGPAMDEYGIERADTDWTVGFLEHADLAKFAKHEPARERAVEDLEAVEAFVERTRFMGEPEVDEPGEPERHGRDETNVDKPGEPERHGPGDRGAGDPESDETAEPEEGAC